MCHDWHQSPRHPRNIHLHVRIYRFAGQMSCFSASSQALNQLLIAACGCKLVYVRGIKTQITPLDSLYEARFLIGCGR